MPGRRRATFVNHAEAGMWAHLLAAVGFHIVARAPSSRQWHGRPGSYTASRHRPVGTPGQRPAGALADLEREQPPRTRPPGATATLDADRSRHRWPHHLADHAGSATGGGTCATPGDPAPGDGERPPLTPIRPRQRHHHESAAGDPDSGQVHPAPPHQRARSDPPQPPHNRCEVAPQPMRALLRSAPGDARSAEGSRP
jgi:hypothetical protein